jgi:hypothetical protein
MITASELTQLQATVSGSMDVSYTLKRAVYSADTYGQQSVSSYTTVSTGNCTMAQPTAGQMQNYAFVIGSLDAWQIRLPYGVTAQRGDHLIIGGKTLVVQALMDLRSRQLAVHLLATVVI